METLHKDGRDGDHHMIGGLMMEFTVEPWRDGDHYDSKGHTIHNLI
jgi:hypothetical protein